MHLKQLTIQNFMSIGSGHLDFEEGGLTLIEGKNEDSPSSESNGAGKSTLYEALYWVLWGKTKRGLTGDDVVNNVAGKNCMVTLIFDDYLVVRWRKKEGKTEDKNGLKLYRLGADDEKEDISRGTSRDTQELLTEIMGMSERTFLMISSFGQGDVKPFASLSDKELKEVFEQSLGFTFLSEYQAKVKMHIAELETERESFIADIDMCQQKIDLGERELELISESITDFEDRRKAELKRIEDELEAALKEREKLSGTSAPSKSEIATKKAKLGEIEEKLAKLDEVAEKFKKDHDDLKIRHASEKTNSKSATSQLTKLKGEKTSATAKIGTPCGECGKIYAENDLSAFIEKISSRIAEAEKTSKTAADAEIDLFAQLSKMEEVSSRLGDQLAELYNQKSAMQTEISTAKVEATNTAKNIEALDKRKTLLEDRANEVRTEANPHGKKHPSAKAKLDDLKASKRKLEHELKKFSEKIETAKLLSNIFANDGLKSYLLDNVTPELNELIDANIKVLDDIDVEVSTMKKLKSGKLSEKFDIKVTNEHGAHTYKGNSGGELQKINLAIALAFNALVRSIHSSSINVIFLDEPFESLDEGSSEKVLELCEAIAADGSTFLITHNPSVKELCSNVITVQKKGGLARIV